MGGQVVTLAGTPEIFYLLCVLALILGGLILELLVYGIGTLIKEYRRDRCEQSRIRADSDRDDGGPCL